MKYAAVLLVIGFFSFFNCQAIKPDSVIVVAFSQGKKITIKVHKGDLLLVELPISSGTGFVWEVLTKPTLCKQGDMQYKNVKSNVPGASLMQVLNFSIKDTGIEYINFVYHRPFEKNKPPAKTRTLRLVVQ